MRINDREVEIIKENTQRIFGSQCRVFLFGSRTDDSQRGGDIDLYIETRLDVQEALTKRQKLILDLKDALGDQKIDIVVKARGSADKYVYKVAKSTGVELLSR